jgi:hypothetical protein
MIIFVIRVVEPVKSGGLEVLSGNFSGVTAIECDGVIQIVVCPYKLVYTQ